MNKMQIVNGVVLQYDRIEITEEKGNLVVSFLLGGNQQATITAKEFSQGMVFNIEGLRGNIDLKLES